MAKRGSPEWRRKISEARKGKGVGRKLTDDHLKKLIELRKGHKANEETRRKISEAVRRLWQDEEYRASVLEARKPWYQSEELRKKMREVNKGKRQPDSVRKKISQALKGKPTWNKDKRLSEEHREKISNGLKRYLDMLSPEERTEWAKRIVGATAGTSIERAVWEILDALGVEYETQKRIGPYFVDIYVSLKNLVIECDGEWWHSQPEAIRRDKAKDTYLKKRGYYVLRLPERVIRGGEASQVLEDVLFGGVVNG